MSGIRSAWRIARILAYTNLSSWRIVHVRINSGICAIYVTIKNILKSYTSAISDKVKGIRWAWCARACRWLNKCHYVTTTKHRRSCISCIVKQQRLCRVPYNLRLLAFRSTLYRNDNYTMLSQWQALWLYGTIKDILNI